MKKMPFLPYVDIYKWLHIWELKKKLIFYFQRVILLRKRENKPLGFGHLDGAFYILIIGFIVATIAFILEILVKKMCST